MIIDQLHKQFGDMPNLRAREIKVDSLAKKISCTISYPNVKFLDDVVRNDIISCVKAGIPQGYFCVVTFAEDTFGEDSFKQYVYDVIKKDYPYLQTIRKDKMLVNIDGHDISVVFKVNQVDILNLEACDFCNKLVNSFGDYSCYRLEANAEIDTEAQIVIDTSDLDKRTQLAFNKQFMKPSRYFQVYDLQKCVGKIISTNPMYIADVRKASDSCVLCGTISEKTSKVSAKNPLIKITRFVLTDKSGGSINCVLFTKLLVTDLQTIVATENISVEDAEKVSETRKKRNANREKAVVFLNNDISVVVRGKVGINDFSGKMEMIVYDLNKCRIADSDTEVFDRPVNQDYLLVEPTKYLSVKQEDFFDLIERPSYLTGKSVVILHANASGYNATKDKLYAICGVKLVDGKLSEKFFSYVNPETVVNDATLQTLRTTSTKLTASPTITELVSDLYKFCYGSIIVSDNVKPLLEYLNYYAQPFKYRFDNEAFVQTDFLSLMFDNSILEKKLNLAKYEHLSQTLKVQLPVGKLCSDTAEFIARCVNVLTLKTK